MAILGAVVPAFPQSGPAGVTPVRGVEHGAPLRLLAPVKIGLKNIKAITQISYSVEEFTERECEILVGSNDLGETGLRERREILKSVTEF
jgi:DMSO/TMAO reductase YedYZ molybdopterin-dependent catalytic subunit